MFCGRVVFETIRVTATRLAQLIRSLFNLQHFSKEILARIYKLNGFERNEYSRRYLNNP